MELSNTFYTSERKKWREWLTENFEKEKEIWLVLPKKESGEKGISYNDSVEEALCFGWIDSTVKELDSLHRVQPPLAAKILAGITVGYALSPIDLIPDFISLLGYLDDIIILPALIALTIRLIPKDTYEKFRKEAEGMWQSGKPKKWYYAIPISLIWLFVIWLIIKSAFL